MRERPQERMPGAGWSRQTRRARLRLDRHVCRRRSCILAPRIMTASDRAPAADRRRWPSAVAPAPERQLDAATTPPQIGDALREAPEGIAGGRCHRRRTARLGRRAAAAALRPPPRHRRSTSSPSTTTTRRWSSAIEDVADDRPKKQARVRFQRRAGRLGYAVHDNWTGRSSRWSASSARTWLKLLRMFKEPGRFRPTATVHHMEQVGLDAVPLVVLLSLPGRRGDRLPRRQHPARLRRDDLRGRTGQHRLPARVRRAADRDRPGRPHRQRVHRADRRDGQPRGGRCDPHARPGPDRPAGDPAHAGAAGDAAAADLHRDDLRPARRPHGRRLRASTSRRSSTWRACTRRWSCGTSWSACPRRRCSRW